MKWLARLRAWWRRRREERLRRQAPADDPFDTWTLVFEPIDALVPGFMHNLGTYTGLRSQAMEVAMLRVGEITWRSGKMQMGKYGVMSSEQSHHLIQVTAPSSSSPDISQH